jgi:murein DD-endopeptidase MepM/ murein hydrolase activator NlpD
MMTVSRRSFLRSLVPVTSALALGGRLDERLLRFSPEERAGPFSRPADGRPAATLDQTQTAPVRAPEPPTLHLLSPTVAQGGTFLVIVTGDGILSATVGFRDWEHPMVPEGNAFLAVVPAGQPVGAIAQPAPGAYRVTVRLALGGAEQSGIVEETIRVLPTDFPVEYLTFEPGVATLLDPALTVQETAILRDAYGVNSGPRLWDGFFSRPSPAPVSDVYGSRRSYQGGPVTGSHSGVDFGAAAGSPVAAAATGRVALARALPVRGNTVILDHGAGVFTGYCHLSEIWVAPGQTVRAGAPIAAVGATGLVTGAHLHWEVVAGGQHVDGLRWLAL